MSLVALASARRSPGVTTTAVALGSVWPAPATVVVAELDPSGGDLAPRYGCTPSTGLTSLAAAARRVVSPEQLMGHTTALPGGVQALVAPVSADQARPALAGLLPRLAPELARLAGVDVLADCGRLDPGSPATEVVRAAQLTLLVTRPVREDLDHLRWRLAPLRALGAEVVVVVVGTRPYPPTEVAAFLGTEVLVVADDPRSAAVLAGSPGTDRALARSPLVRSVRSLADAVAARLGAPPPSTDPPPRRRRLVPARRPAQARGG